MPEAGTPRRKNRSAAETRAHVLAVARELFYWHGITTVGVDRVASEAEVATTTLYRLFGSKDGLIAAYVEREGADHLRWFEESLGSATRPPRTRLLDLFDAVGGLLRADICRGCPFQLTLAERPDPADAAHRAAVHVKAEIRARFGELAAEHVRAQKGRGSAAAARIADHLMLVYEGAFAVFEALGESAPAPKLRPIVAAILDN